MTKGELIKALEPFDDDIPVFRPNYNEDGERSGEAETSRVTYTVQDGEGTIILE